MVVYFGKLNLNSNHIYKVYKNELKLIDVMNNVLHSLIDGITYEREEIYKDGIDIKLSTTKYRLTIREKTDEYVMGYLYKDAKIYYKQFDEDTNELEWRHVVANEAADFYLDASSEMVGYVTASRFGYREFLEAFAGIVNNSLEETGLRYRFTVELLTAGMSVSEIIDELKTIGNIQKLKIKIQPPNIQDDLLDYIENDPEDTISNFEEANIGTKSIIITSSDTLGLNINSKEIREQLNQVGKIHSKITSEDVTKNGYVEVEATDNYGNRITTGDKKALKKEIDNIIEFKYACQRVITNRKIRGNGGNETIN